MPMDENLFSGIPALGDEAGLEQFLTNEAVQATGVANSEIPAALRQATTETTETTPTTPTQTTTEPTTETPTMYTAEQVQAIIQSLQAQQAQTAAAQTAPVVKPAQTFQGYTPQEQNAITQLLAKGYSLEQIMHAVNNRRQANAQPQANNMLMQRLAAVEQHLQQQAYEREQAAFVDKMTTFGNKFGLSEDDLVTFGNFAMSKGINLTQVTDVEAIFRALYPEQYHIRTQRMSNAPTSQIYGGASATETPQAIANATADAYVEGFLRRAMPNDYSRHLQKK